MVGVAEVESATFCVSCKRSNQLSYTPEKKCGRVCSFQKILASPFFKGGFARGSARGRARRERDAGGGFCGGNGNAFHAQQFVARRFPGNDGNATFRHAENFCEKCDELGVRASAFGNGLHFYFQRIADDAGNLRFFCIRDGTNSQEKRIARSRIFLRSEHGQWPSGRMTISPSSAPPSRARDSSSTNSESFRSFAV